MAASVFSGSAAIFHLQQAGHRSQCELPVAEVFADLLLNGLRQPAQPIIQARSKSLGDVTASRLQGTLRHRQPRLLILVRPTIATCNAAWKSQGEPLLRFLRATSSNHVEVHFGRFSSMLPVVRGEIGTKQARHMQHLFHYQQKTATALWNNSLDVSKIILT